MTDRIERCCVCHKHKCREDSGEKALYCEGCGEGPFCEVCFSDSGLCEYCEHYDTGEDD